MDIGAILIGLAILVLAIPFVASPFRGQKKTRNQQEKAIEKQIRPEDRKQQEETVLKKIQALDFDYQTGKIAVEDYRPLRDQMVAEAAQLIEAVKQEEEQLEEKLRLRREAKARKITCPACGGALNPVNKYCPACGQPVATKCPICGKPIQVGDLFCSGCGSPVKKPSGTAVANQL